MKQLNRSFVVAITLTTACGVDADVSTDQVEQTVDRSDAVEQVLCTLDACLVHDLHDTDGDGVSDVDEQALGTDPNDARSRPLLDGLLDRIKYDRLPSFLDGHSIVIVLPTRFPDGRSLFGGRAAMPSRRAVLDRLGITSSMLDKMDMTQGLTLTNHGSTSHPSLGARGMKWSLVGASTNGANDAAMADALRLGSRNPVSSVDVGSTSRSGAFEFGSFTIHHEGGRDEEVTYKKSPSTLGVEIRYKDNGEPFGTTQLTRRKDPDGTEVKTETTTKTGDCTVGCKTQTTTTSKTSTTSADQKTTYTETTKTTTTVPKVGPTTVRVETGITCTGDCPMKDDTGTTTCASSDAGGCAATEEASTTALTSADYVDWSPSPELVRAVLAGLGATILVVDPTGEGPRTMEIDPMGKANKYGPISLVAEEGSTQPLVFHLPSEAQPETRSDLPHAELGGVGTTPCTYCGQ